MSFVFTFTPNASGMNTGKYDKCISRLEEAGADDPKGRLYHVCFGDPNDLMVTDVWDSVKNFEKFGETLMPILKEIGIDPVQPAVHPVHNVIEALPMYDCFSPSLLPCNLAGAFFFTLVYRGFFI